MKTLPEEPGETFSVKDEMEGLASTSATITPGLTSAHSHPRQLAALMLSGGPTAPDPHYFQRNGRRPSAPSFYQHLESALSIRRPSGVATTTSPPQQHRAIALRRPSAVMPAPPIKFPPEEERQLINESPNKVEIKEEEIEKPEQPKRKFEYYGVIGPSSVVPPLFRDRSDDVFQVFHQRRGSFAVVEAYVRLPILGCLGPGETPSLYYLGRVYPRGCGYPDIVSNMTLVVYLSAMYGKLLVFLGIAFPITETIAVDSYYYQGYYLSLYIGTFIFLGFMYGTVLRSRAIVFFINSYRRNSLATYKYEYKKKNHRHHRYGSFYLRLGAVAFGIGSMVFSGLEFGQYFELRESAQCRGVTRALTPAARMLLTLVQMQFIFLSNRSIDIGRHSTVAHFGLAHMVAMNLCEWLYVIVEEAKHEIEHLPSNAHGSHGGHGGHGGHSVTVADQVHAAIVNAALPLFNVSTNSEPLVHHVHRRSAEAGACEETHIIGSLVRNAAPFLFPCTIEYSLICAVILFEMWKHAHESQGESLVKVHRSERDDHDGKDTIASESDFQPRSVNHLSVDCTKAHKGLFSGILLVVLTIIALILFFVLNEAKEYQPTSLLVVNICELTLYLLTTLAVLIASCQMRVIPYKDESSALGLDNSLLVMAQTGMFMYCLFSIIGYHFTNSESRGLVVEVTSLVQTVFQTIFVLDASRRRITSVRQWRLKPGRQWVTFLLVANMAMWIVNTLEKSHAEFRPTHLQFFGVWAWTIITHISMPLAIFYRFHSTICLFEIWKSCYKYKSGRESLMSNC